MTTTLIIIVGLALLTFPILAICHIASVSDDAARKFGRKDL